MSTGTSTSRAYYNASVEAFLATTDDQILGELARRHSHATDELQRNAWLGEISVLKTQLARLGAGHIFLEFAIPRMGKRADAVLLFDGIVFVLEFKVGTQTYDHASIDQAIDYAVDLSNFHEGSHNRLIVPMLIATRAPAAEPALRDSHGSLSHVLANEKNLAALVKQVVEVYPGLPSIEPEQWAQSRYRPTPTIIEAAQALYHGHRVEEISRAEAGAINLSATSDCLASIIQQSKTKKQKSICFVTGVPGAGKTLAGLNLACSRQRLADDEHAVFLSGNGPLVDVLREALAREQASREGVSRAAARTKTQAFIQNIHHFRDDSLATDQPPIERVVIFDEAQRAWDKDHLARFMAEKKGRQDFAQSEPEFLLSVMDRVLDWCTVVCLVGGGQEINDGEAGISEWFSALRRSFPHWQVWCSPKLGTGAYETGAPLDVLAQEIHIETREELHLGVSLRSFRSEALSDFVHAVLEGNASRAAEIYGSLKDKYPIAFSRHLPAAKHWVRSQARGNELVGLLASSGALRLKADGLHVKAKVDAVDWFLNGKADVRSCHYLEDVATEFDVQGLELDWTCVCWDAELRRESADWSHFQFRGTTWSRIRQASAQRYLQNTYRVLLTRARQGMVLFIPQGDAKDPTRAPAIYDAIAEYLAACGVPKVEES